MLMDLVQECLLLLSVGCGQGIDLHLHIKD